MNIRLRTVEPSDIPLFFDDQNDPEALRLAAFTPRERDAFFAHWAKILADPANLNRTIEVDGRVAGNIASFLRGDEREVGYWLGREWWGKGVATEALRIFLEIETRRPLFAGVASHNIGSIRVLQKCGFEMFEEIADFAPGGISGLALKLR
jgi:RimJ/RimL family protein N-acetyltransferase